jgi:hypothetical protein
MTGGRIYNECRPFSTELSDASGLRTVAKWKMCNKPTLLTDGYLNLGAGSAEDQPEHV